MPLLARELELSPAAISAAARQAALLSAAGKRPVTMSELLMAVQNELEKFGREAELTSLREETASPP